MFGEFAKTTEFALKFQVVTVKEWYFFVFFEIPSGFF
jgi:hypothetical protein